MPPEELDKDGSGLHGTPGGIPRGDIHSLADIALAYPWLALTQEQAALLAEELGKELHEDHQLYGHELIPVAMKIDSDDAIFHLPKLACVALVHLTWRRGREFGPWPGTSLIQAKAELNGHLRVDAEAYAPMRAIMPALQKLKELRLHELRQPPRIVPDPEKAQLPLPPPETKETIGARWRRRGWK